MWLEGSSFQHQSKAIKDASCVNLYLLSFQLVWYRHVQGPSLLIADTFGPHTAPTTQRALVAKGSCLAIIPSACSANLQPLHRGIKQNFKVQVSLAILGDYVSEKSQTANTKTSISLLQAKSFSFSSLFFASANSQIANCEALLNLI